MAQDQRWCRVTIVSADGTAVGGCVMTGPRTPDLEAVNAIARLSLVVGRAGGRITLADVSPALRELLELSGLPVEVQS